ncbi:hypothetical protein QYE76_035681 [Lolium multiflorum]|uniref:F-box domain-containing protein n=1 Tax=Lolium multiflorum TaxID=4521 RepID=A0AAD8QZN8_LOLMU|nr:hypothetical protein QYE76_035681 [Lolium multiflorum]
MNRSEVPVAETGLPLPPEVVEHILLRVPGRQLRRLRAVCRSWRSLLSDSSFLKMHAAFRPALILALAENDNRIDVVDFSGGHIIKQIRVPATPEEEAVLSTNPGSSFLFQANNRIRMVDPDSGAVFTLPSDDLGRLTLSHPVRFVKTDYVLGRAASTRHHKVLRILTGKAADRVDPLSSPFKQLCHVLTLGDDDDNREWQCWRERPSPPMFVKSNVDFHGVTIQGSVFFLAGNDFTYCDTSYPCNRMMYQTRTDSIASFDLEKEQWRPATLRGPPEMKTSVGACRRVLAELNNTLVVMVYCYFDNSCLEFWFAEDLEKDIWVKKHAVRQELLEPCPYMSLDMDIRQVMELDDGRIVFSYYVTWAVKVPLWLTRVYDPGTKVYADLPQIGDRGIVGMYVKTPSLYT